MKTTTSYSFHALFLVLSLLLVAPALAQQPDRVGAREVKTAQWRGKHIQYAEGKVSVKLKEGANKGVARNAVQVIVRRTLQDFDELGWGFFEVPKGQSVLEAVRELEKLPSVSIAHPVSVGTIGTAPDDDFLSNQWGLINTSQNAGTVDSDIDAELAWDHTIGNSDVVIAVLDTGIPMQEGSLSHEDLDNSSKIILGPDYVNDGNGVKDEHGHGTHVAGTAAAETNNDRGVAGVCWNCKILVIQTNDGSNQFAPYDEQWFYNGIKYASDYKTNNPGTEVVINFSSGGPNDDPVYHDAIQYAQNRGILIVSIAHNDNGGDVRYPAALSTQYSNMVAVSATDHNDDFASYSNSGPEVNVAAPGGYGASDSRSIYSTLPDYATTGYGSNTNYGYSDGTSMAAPHVAGTAALMLSEEPSLSPLEIRTILEDTAEDVNGGGFDHELGHGRINAYEALRLRSATISGPFQVDEGDPATWTAEASGGVGPYTYSWQQRVDSGEPWYGIPCGTDASCTHAFEDDKGGDQASGIKVYVTDSNYDQVSDQQTVIVLEGSGDGGCNALSPHQICQNVENDSAGASAASAEATGVAARPESFALEGSHPNPARNRATIRYALPEQAEVTLVVYDVTGRRVATLATGSRPAGFHEVTFDASALPSGVYVYRLQAGAFTDTRQMVVVK